MVLIRIIEILEKMSNLHSAVYKISHISLFLGEDEERRTKFSQNTAESFAESFAKISAKFHELKISTKPQH